MARAQTGTGKTAAFVLPMLEMLKKHANTSFSPARHPVRALVVTPTRELAVQIADSVKAYGRYVPVKSAVVYGGVPMEPQKAQLLAGVEILVATPGRLLDHASTRGVNLGSVEILVLDEADRMLDMGFIDDIRKIVALLPAKRQNLMFSATFSAEIRALAKAFQNDPAQVDVTPKISAVESVEQVVYLVDADRKRELLAYLVRKRDLRQVWSSRAPSTWPPAWPHGSTAMASTRRPSTAIAPSRSARRPWRTSSAVRSASWWPRMWPPVGLTSRHCRKW